jgi:predicted enzyme related to lactoylglutathione lyase
MTTGRLQGLRTTIYKVTDAAKAKAWYSKVFGIEPYFDEPFYIGFNVGGFELGLDPDVSDQKPGPGGGLAYWGVASMDSTMKALKADGVKVRSEPRDVGDGIKVAAIEDPFGNVIGLIENPHFGHAETA